MHLLKPPYDTSSALLKSIDNTWRALLIILLLPLFLLAFILVVFGSIMRSFRREETW